MSVRFVISFLWVAAVIGLPSCAVREAANPFEGRVISRVDVLYLVGRPVDEERLESLVGVEAGDNYSQADVDQGIRDLWESGYVEDVRFLAEAEGAKVKVVIEITIRRPMGLSLQDHRIENEDWLSPLCRS